MKMILTTGDVWNLPAKKNTRWGRWRLRKKTNVLLLYVDRRVQYLVDLDQMKTSAQCLDWIFQASNKVWMTTEDRGNLIEAIQELIDPQATLCSWGIERGASTA
jgi:hypothetical protein